MAVLLFFAPIEHVASVTTTPPDSICDELITQFGLFEDNQNQNLPFVWKYGDAYCVWRPTLKEAVDIAMQCYEQNLRAKYENPSNWIMETQRISWEDYAEPFLVKAQELIDQICPFCWNLQDYSF